MPIATVLEGLGNDVVGFITAIEEIGKHTKIIFSAVTSLLILLLIIIISFLLLLLLLLLLYYYYYYYYYQIKLLKLHIPSVKVMIGTPLVIMDRSCKSLVEGSILNPQAAGSGTRGDMAYSVLRSLSGTLIVW